MMPIPELPSPLEWAAAMANGFFREMSVRLSTTLPRACSGDRPMPPSFCIDSDRSGERRVCAVSC